jgi:two-component system sensor histidine kinase BarA
MSYRSVKRVLGETRLELKCLALFAICLLTLIGGSFWWYGGQTEDLVYDKTSSTCRNLIDAIIPIRHWSTFDKDYKEVVEQWAQKMKAQNYDYKFINPNKLDEKTDANDLWVLEQFPRSVAIETPEENKEVTLDADVPPIAHTTPDGEWYHYYQPVYYVDQKCVDCHYAIQEARLGSAGLTARTDSDPKLGDMISVVKIVIPFDSTKNALNENRAIFIATGIVTVFLAMIASYVIVRYVIVKPLKHLRDISDEISRGNMEARAEIHTADEFEELGMAFNKMVRHLVTTQDELKNANSELDGKVDELAQLNMRLYEMNRLKSDFLATMSHELRTPLNSIIGFSEVLDSIKPLDDKQRRYVQNIQKSGRVLLDMINDILDLAKIESGKMEVRLSDFRIDKVVHAQCDFFKPQTDRKNIDLEIDVDPNLPELFQDQSKVQQILSNLLSNAIKFTPEGGRIVVRARRDTAGDDLLLIVSDTGVGIAEEDKVAIFEKFRQGKAVMTQGDAITREYSGTGLGLSIVKELCKLLGGEVTLESQLGRGSTFTVRLPWTCPGQPRFDAATGDNMEEMLRPQRQEIHRTLDRAVPATPGVER